MVKDKQRRAQADDEPSLCRFWKLLVAIIGAIATLELTELLPVLYWPGVMFVYVGLRGMFGWCPHLVHSREHGDPTRASHCAR